MNSTENIDVQSWKVIKTTHLVVIFHSIKNALSNIERTSLLMLAAKFHLQNNKQAAREEYEKGNITRAKELNSNALGLGIAGIAISIFVGVAVVIQHLLL